MPKNNIMSAVSTPPVLSDKTCHQSDLTVSKYVHRLLVPVSRLFRSTASTLLTLPYTRRKEDLDLGNMAVNNQN